ncbi:threonine synthase [Methanogenium cariaci]|jgi:threonine synthase
MYRLVCIGCGREYSPDDIIYHCRECGHLLTVKYDLDSLNISRAEWNRRPLNLWRYRELLPVTGDPVTLQEGGTPLYHMKRLGEELGLKHLYAKHEGMNPSGSFKDRGMTVGVSMAMQLGMKTVACASTGNTSAALAVYAAKAGIPAVVLLPAGNVALGKVAQALMHGAKVIAIRDNFDRALEMVHDLCISEGLYLLNSVNPYRLEGQKTIGFEVVDQLGDVPDRIVLPVGNAGNISAVHKGLGEFIELGFADRMPMMTGIQAAGSQPVVEAISGNLPEVIPFKSPETVATAIRIGAPVNAEKALRAIRQTGGTAESVTDEEILSMQRDLARKEGIGVEPASAASVAGIKKLVEEGRIDPDERIVCVVTGHLLKDPETVIRQCSPPIEIDADIQSLLSVLR